eukprot:SAG11_NODE_16244_length_553_cov_1.099119_1_plen_113_part_00
MNSQTAAAAELRNSVFGAEFGFTFRASASVSLRSDSVDSLGSAAPSSLDLTDEEADALAAPPTRKSFGKFVKKTSIRTSPVLDLTAGRGACARFNAPCVRSRPHPSWGTRLS